MIKFTILLRRRPDLSHEEFVTYHREKHAPLFMSMPVVQEHDEATFLDLAACEFIVSEEHPVLA